MPLFICTDLDRTLIPNGPQSESPEAREHFAMLAGHPDVKVAFVTGRHRVLVDQAINNYRLPRPDFVIGDVGTTIYQLGPDGDWVRQVAWEREIAQDWGGRTRADIRSLLIDLPAIRPQEMTKQNDYKLSYYVPLHSDRDRLSERIEDRLRAHGVNARLIWSVDEPAGVGLLDVVPARASKYHAIEALIATYGFSQDETVFCGDSGNDIEVLASPIPAVLVANCQPQVRELATRLARERGYADRLYVAKGGFMGMNGNYGAGMLEGIAHYHPRSIDWMGFRDDE